MFGGLPGGSEGFPDSSVGKESTCNARDPGLIPGSGRSAGEGIGYPLQYSWASLVAQLVKKPPAMWDPWIGKIPWRRERLPTPVFWPGEFHGLYRPWGHKESDTTKQLSLSLVAQNIKNLPAMQEIWVQSLGLEDALEKGMATCSSLLAWEIPWTEEPAWLLGYNFLKVFKSNFISMPMSKATNTKNQNHKHQFFFISTGFTFDL